MTRPSKHIKGFTLIELLVVISIIGLLSSVILAALSTSREKAKEIALVQEIKQLQLALELYHSKYGDVPLGMNMSDHIGLTDFRDALQPLVTEGLLPRIPSSPEWPNNTNVALQYYRFDGIQGQLTYYCGERIQDKFMIVVYTEPRIKLLPQLIMTSILPNGTLYTSAQSNHSCLMNSY